MYTVSFDSIKSLYVACGALYGHCRFGGGDNIVVACVNWCERSCLIDGYGCGSKGYTPVGLH